MTSQQIPEKRLQKININILPKEFMPVKKSMLTVGLVLAIIILIGVMATFVVMKFGVNSDVAASKTKITELDKTIAARNANYAEAKVIEDKIKLVDDQIAAMNLDYTVFKAANLNWSDIVAEIDDLLLGSKLTLSSISPAETDKGITITLQGNSLKRIYVYDYVTVLEKSDFFKGVDFSFGDCPETSACAFTVTAPLDLVGMALNNLGTATK